MLSKYENHTYKTHVLVSTDIHEIYAFLRKNCTTAGFSIQYGISSDGRCYHIMKKGKPGKREIKRLVAEYGIKEWHYSWCWASDKWLVNGQVVEAIEIDLSPVATTRTAVQYKGLLY